MKNGTGLALVRNGMGRVMDFVRNNQNLFKYFAILVIYICINGITPSKTYTFTNKNSIFNEIILEAAKLNNLHPALISAIIHAESNFNPRARSDSGARGLMQINGPTQAHLKLKNAYDPYQNIHAGSKYIRILLDRFNGDILLTIAAYNAGPGTIKRYAGIPPYTETKRYIKKVLTLFDYYRGVKTENS